MMEESSGRKEMSQKLRRSIDIHFLAMLVCFAAKFNVCRLFRLVGGSNVSSTGVRLAYELRYAVGTTIPT